MIVIKRYANRKLYDTEVKQYISLDGIAEIIRAGGDVRVIDNVSGEDITAQTLSQIILNRQKKQSGFVPRPILATLVEAGGRSLGYLREKLEPHVNQLEELEVEEKLQQRVQSLIRGGEIAEETGQKLINQFRERAAGWCDSFSSNDRLFHVVMENTLPHRDDIQKIIAQIDELTAKLDQLDKEK